MAPIGSYTLSLVGGTVLQNCGLVRGGVPLDEGFEAFKFLFFQLSHQTYKLSATALAL